MQRNEKPKFVVLIQALAAAFRVEVTEAILEGYWLALDDLDLIAVGVAVKRGLRESKFMPSANELRGLSGEVRSEHRAVLAWDAFASAVVRHGGYASVDFDDPLINATIRHLGGWCRVCELPTNEFDTFLKKDFERVYAALFASGVAIDRCGPLLGIHAAENALAGFQSPPPTKIATGLPPPPESLIRQAIIQQPSTQTSEASNGLPNLHHVERVAGSEMEEDSRRRHGDGALRKLSGILPVIVDQRSPSDV